MAPSRRDCRCDMIFLSGCLLLSVLGFQPALAKVCNDYTRHGLDNNWYTRDGEKLPIMVLMPMNESALMSSISQGIEPAVQLAIQHIRESRQYSFSLITKIYDTECRAIVSYQMFGGGKPSKFVLVKCTQVLHNLDEHAAQSQD
ncbi:gamma-aminobutyric acid type B receptor subunit 2 [Labeo rohita]|uniref:Gamma-aminobutyric acid type B receptor subunit 2 n=1 Tax=Labeo rohita TaxID=84645 RepID=A0A498MVM3_LABRO|nr:gamma-aminobutyric acid type B receptor subunit 2 [Labeo rohita]